MTIAKLLNSAVSKYPYTWADFMADNNNTQGLNPADLLTIFPQTDMAKQGYSLVEIAPAAQPSFDLITQSCTELPPVLISGIWTQQWGTVALDATTISANQATAIASSNALIKAQLAELDIQSVRALREPSAASTTKLANLTAQATTLRSQLK